MRIVRSTAPDPNVVNRTSVRVACWRGSAVTSRVDSGRPLSMFLRCTALGSAAALAIGCFGGNGPVRMLGENFPPHDIAFLEYEAPTFPSRLRPTGISSGYAVVVVTVDEDDRVDDVVVVEASDAAFGAAVLEVTPAWIFGSAPGETLPRRELMHFVFRRSGVVASLSHREGAKRVFEDSESGVPPVHMVSSGDVELAPVASPAPVTAGEPSGVVAVSFVVDQTGRVRVPTVTGASDPALASAALTAIGQWRFAPPMDGADSVLVEATHEFAFTPEER